MAITLSDIITTVRELTFDRFCIPTLTIKASSGYTIAIDATKIRLTTDNEDTDILFTEFPTLDKITDRLISLGFIIAYPAYFSGVEDSKNLLPVPATSLSSNITLFRRNFFSNSTIIKEIAWYYYDVLNIPDVAKPTTPGSQLQTTSYPNSPLVLDAPVEESISDTDIAVDPEASILLEQLIPQLIFPGDKHLAYKVAYAMLDKRRTYENAATFITPTFTDGSNYVESSAPTSGQTTTVAIGDVFSITEDPKNGFFYDDFNRIGSDNIWGDRFSFWYKLMMFLRDKLEQEFDDYSLRKDTIMQGQTQLIKPTNIHAYFDSYPFTLSPFSRGILS